MRKEDLKTYLIDFQIKYCNANHNEAEAKAMTYLGLEMATIDNRVKNVNSKTLEAIKEIIKTFCYENKLSEDYFYQRRFVSLIKTKQVLMYFAGQATTKKKAGKMFRKDHSTIIHAERIIENVKNNPIYDIDLYSEYLRIS